MYIHIWYQQDLRMAENTNDILNHHPLCLRNRISVYYHLDDTIQLSIVFKTLLKLN